LHKAAAEYAELGWPVFPVEPNGKRPLTPNGFKDATTARAQIDMWWKDNPLANIGTEPECSGYCVIDVEAEGLDEWAMLQGMHGSVPPTWAVKTPRGGQHLWFEGSLPSLVRPFGKAVAIDTRGRGGYVLLPGSIVNGVAYETADDFDIAELPRWFAAKITERKHDRQEAPLTFQADLGDNVRRAGSWLAGQPVPIHGARNDATYKAACKLKDLGLSPQKTLDMLLAWAPIAEDFTEDEVYGRVVSAFENGQNAPGNDAVIPSREAFANVLANITAANQHAPETIHGPVPFSAVLKRDVQPVAELIPGLIEKGVATMLAGPGGVHKSRTAVHWGLSISAGLPVYGRSTERARFVFLSYEDHADEVARRSQAMTSRLKCDWGDDAEYWDMTQRADPLAIVSDVGIETTAFYDRFRAHLLSIPGLKFVVLDSTYNALAFLGQTKISEPAVKGAIELLNRICRETDSTILFLWHPSQAGQERGDASGWSVAWHNAPRARVSLSRIEKGKDAFELRVEKRNNAATGQPLTLHWDNGLLLPISAVGADEQSARFTEACVKVAIEAAAKGAPIQMQRRLHDWQIKEIDFDCGKRPTDREVKAELARAIHLRLLRYVKGEGKNKAGYYPFDVDKGPFLSGEIMSPALCPNNSNN
jgi:hypothetical protein